MKNKKDSKLMNVVYTLLLILLSILVVLIIIVRICDMISPPEKETTTAELTLTTKVSEYPIELLLTAHHSIAEPFADFSIVDEPDIVVTEEPDIVVAEEPEETVFYREDIPLDAEVQKVLYDVCESEGVNYTLVLGLIQTESNFDTQAKNQYSGCYGLMQLHPAYFPSDLTPSENVEYGVKYLADCIERYNGDIKAALRAYNAGSDDGVRTYSNVIIEAAKAWGYSV